MVTMPIPTPDKIKFERTITLGTVIQIVTFNVLISMAYATLAQRQQTDENAAAQLQRQVNDLNTREELGDQISARTSAILDGVEMRVHRLELQQDRVK